MKRAREAASGRGLVGERPEQKGRGQGELAALRNWKQLREALRLRG